MGGVRVLDSSLDSVYRRARARIARALVLSRLGRADAFSAFCELFAEGRKLMNGPLSPEAELLEALKANAVAQAAYRQHVETRKADADEMRRAGGVWIRAGQSADALTAWDAVVGLQPHDATAWFGKAEAHAQAEQFAHAIAAYERALVLWPEFIGAAARMKVIKERAGLT